MKQWGWVAFFSFAFASHYIFPETWRWPIVFGVGMAVLAYLGSKFDDLHSRITFLEAQLKAHESLLDETTAHLSIDVQDRFYEIERHLPAKQEWHP